MSETFFFTNHKGQKLCGILANPTDSIDVPLVIGCHGFASSKESSTFRELEQRLNHKGIAFFRFDFHGHGDSEGDFENLTVTQAEDDVLSAIAFVRSKGYTSLGLVGSSMGGIACILAAAESPKLKTLALKCPVSNHNGLLIAKASHTTPEQWRKKGFLTRTTSEGKKVRLSTAFLDDDENYDGYEAAKHIAMPTLIVHGDADSIVPLEDSKKLLECLPKGKLEVVTGANHQFEKADQRNKMYDLLEQFLVKELKK